MENYKKGINLGGWISQYGEFNPDHFKAFIKEEDIKRIAGWGLDHVRLPVDYPVLEDDQAPFIYKEEGFEYIDNCLSWCKKYGLNLILDLHKTPGYGFFEANNTLFDDEKMQERFISIWKAIAQRYHHEGDNMMYELLNEVVEKNSDRWNSLYSKAVKAIREIDPKRYILVGCNFYSSPKELKNLVRLEDDRIVYNIHFYEPHVFTHQRIKWVDLLREYNMPLTYPGIITGIEEFIQKYPHYDMMRPLAGVKMDKEFLRYHLLEAIEFKKQHNAQVYCGEFGAVVNMECNSRLNWFRDVIDIFCESGIGYAVWSYKGMDFDIVDINGNIVSDELVSIIAGMR
jgi:hypothetical protein